MKLDADGLEFRRRLDIPETAVLIGAVGSLTPRKRHDLFINMAQLLTPRFPNARFIICGHVAGGGKQRYETELRKLGASLLETKRLLMPGMIEDMAAAYAAMDVLAFPSDNEGFGLVAVEAMQMGVPVVRTDTAGGADMIRNGETGFLIPTGDLDALTESVARLLADPDLRRTMAAAAQTAARSHFSAARMAAEVEALILERSNRGG